MKSDFSARRVVPSSRERATTPLRSEVARLLTAAAAAGREELRGEYQLRHSISRPGAGVDKQFVAGEVPRSPELPSSR